MPWAKVLLEACFLRLASILRRTLEEELAAVTIGMWMTVNASAVSVIMRAFLCKPLQGTPLCRITGGFTPRAKRPARVQLEIRAVVWRNTPSDQER